MQFKVSLLYLLFSGSILMGCKDSGAPSEVEGWKPVYKSEIANIPITSQTPQPVEQGGKIYVKGNRLYQVENNKGIHVFDISDPAHPQQLVFINIGGASELAIKDQFLYSNNFNDLVVVDISNLNEAHLHTRIANTFRFTSLNVPPGLGYFECVDESKGPVVGWEYTTLHSPKCKF